MTNVLHKLGHCADSLFDGNSWIRTVEVIQVDVCAQAIERLLDRRLDIFRLAIYRTIGLKDKTSLRG